MTPFDPDGIWRRKGQEQRNSPSENLGIGEERSRNKSHVVASWIISGQKKRKPAKRRERRGDGGSFEWEQLSTGLRKMESSLAFFDGNWEALLEYVQVAIVRQLQVVDACHHTGEVVVWCIWMFAWAAHDSEDRRETLETYIWVCVSGILCGEKWNKHTSNGELGATSDKLKEISALLVVQFAHSLQQVAHTPTVHVEPVIGFDGVH